MVYSFGQSWGAWLLVTRNALKKRHDINHFQNASSTVAKFWNSPYQESGFLGIGHWFSYRVLDVWMCDWSPLWEDRFASWDIFSTGGRGGSGFSCTHHRAIGRTLRLGLRLAIKNRARPTFTCLEILLTQNTVLPSSNEKNKWWWTIPLSPVFYVP